MQTGYLAIEGFESLLRRELKGIVDEYDRLIVADGPPQPVHWVQNIWQDLHIIDFESISDGAKKLRQLQKLWAFYPYNHIRRSELIRKQLPYFAPKPLAFPSPLPTSTLGSWTLLDEKRMLVSPKCSSPFAHGEVHFQESKVPPSRAYLKLWEALTLIQRYPASTERCLEVGASPGSWTWALQQLGTEVIAVDRAALDPQIAQLPRVTFLKKDAFSLSAQDFSNPIDWIFSDVICYPEKLLSWVESWLAFNPKINFVCTLKFQGEEGYDVIEKFEKIAGSQLIHLYHNKHELTWIKVNPT